MCAGGDDDWEMEFIEDDPTRLDPPRPASDTAPHRSVEFLAGRESGFSDGVNATIRALRDRMIARGCSGAEIAAETGAVRAAAEADKLA